MNANILFKIFISCCLLTGFTTTLKAQLPAAPIPELSAFSVVNFYSTKYGTDNRLEFGKWGSGEQTTAKDANDNDVLLFTDYSFMGIVYAEDISNTDQLRFTIYPIKDIPKLELVLILFEGVSPTGKEIRFEHTVGALSAGSWHSVEVDITDFVQQTNYNISAIQPIVSDGGAEFYLDHLYCCDSRSTPPPVGGPTYPAYAPPARSTTNVLSVFSDSYKSGLPDSYPQYPVWGDQTTVASNIMIASNTFLQLNTTNHFPIGLGGINAGEMEFVHIDIYSPDADEVSIFLNDGSGRAVTQTIVKNTWNRIDIPLSAFTGLQSEHIYFVGLEDGDGRTFYIDNIYFFKKQPLQEAEDIHDLNRDLGTGINFGGVFEDAVSPWDDSYLDIAKNAGFEHIRLPVRWDYMNRSLEEAPYNIDEKFMLQIRSIVDKALDKGFRIIINMHHYEPLYADPDAEEERFLAMWGQIAEYFQDYHPSRLLFEPLNEPKDELTWEKWNDLLAKTWAKIRETNPNRAMLIGTADWGGLNVLNQLKLPENDPNLMLTIHYYEPFNFTHQGLEWMGEGAPPVGATWDDTQGERDAVNDHFAQIETFRAKNNNIPVHIGEFAAFDQGDMDSRVLWTTYISNRIKESGYSSAFWDFHIYDLDKGEFVQPILDAILTYQTAEKPAEFATLDINTLYDSKNPGGSSWYFNIDNKNASASGSQNSNGFIIDITDGGNQPHYIQPLLTGLNIEKDKTYKVTFNAKASVGGFTFQSYMGLDGSPYTHYADLFFTPNTQDRTFSYTFTQKEATDPSARIAFDLGGKTGTVPVQITVSDITIKEISSGIFGADEPTEDENDVLSVFGSYYTDNLQTVTYPSGLSTQKTEVKDADNNSIILLSDFDDQTIDFGTTLTPGEKKNLHLNVYPGSFLDLVVTAFEQGISREYTYTLKPHEWNDVDIDLSAFLAETGGKIGSIVLSGGTGKGRKLYLDHIFYYDQSISTGNTIVRPGEEIRFRTDGDLLFVASPTDLRSIAVFDITGHLLINRTINGTTATVNVASVSSDIYLLRITCSSGEMRTFKFIKE